MLTKEQIDCLFDFCQIKGVTCYDVQVELVDHLANAIEKELAEHPDWSFQKALDVVFISFGYRNFAPLVAEKRKAAKIFCRRLWWSIFRKQLTWPGTWVGLGVFLLFYRWLVIHDKEIAFYVSPCVGLIAFFALVIGSRRLKGLKKRTGKLFLLTNITELSPMLNYGFMSIWLINSLSWKLPTRLSMLVIGTLIFAFFLMCLAYYRTVKRLEKKVEKDYPEVFTIA
jgi:hypothetical protein